MIEGVARVQCHGGPVHHVGPGATAMIETGERPWHGASPDRPMVHLALQDAAEDGTEAGWGEVTDAEYDAR